MNKMFYKALDLPILGLIAVVIADLVSTNGLIKENIFLLFISLGTLYLAKLLYLSFIRKTPKE